MGVVSPSHACLLASSSLSHVLSHYPHHFQSQSHNKEFQSTSDDRTRHSDYFPSVHLLFTACDVKIAADHRTSEAKITISILVNHFEKRQTKWWTAHVSSSAEEINGDKKQSLIVRVRRWISKRRTLQSRGQWKNGGKTDGCTFIFTVVRSGFILCPMPYRPRVIRYFIMCRGRAAICGLAPHCDELCIKFVICGNILELY